MTSSPLVPPLPAHADLVVVGGGIVGLAAARACAAEGAEVVVLERGDPGTEASWAAAGMLSPLAESAGPGPFLDFALRSFDLYPAWARAVEDESGAAVEFRPCGKLRVARTQVEEADLERVEALAREAGAVRRVPREELRALEPALGPAVRSGLLIERDGRVDGRRLAEALVTAAGRAGVAIVRAAEVRSIVYGRDARGGRSARGGSVEGVLLRDGRTLAAPRVLLAAGAWSGTIEGLPGPLPVGPVRGQMVSLVGSIRLGRSVEAEGIYLTPRDDGRVLVGATVEEAGFRKEVTEEGIRGLLDAATTLVPEVARARVVERWAGLRPGTPDRLPIIGSWREAPGLLVATGHFRNGILLAPATAEAVADLFHGRTPEALPPEFAPGRFGASAFAAGSGSPR